MNVAKGYKMTEVGVIPEDWEVKAFADVVSLRKQRIDPCRNQSENYDFCIELENIESGSGQILGYSNLRDNASLKSVFYKDDVLFGKLRAYLRKYWLADREGLCSTEIWVFVSKTEQILPSYLFQTIQSKGFIDLAITAYGTHMPRSDWNVVKNYPLLTPPLPEQQAIARVLSDTDELINALDKLIAKKRDIKKAVMQELLTGKTRLPGFSGKWEVKKLGDLLDYEQPTSYLVKNTKYSNSNSIPVLTAGKTFILGYTDENFGVFQDLPVIIFDDFTTASRFIDFPFKVKSSAMKMLKARSNEVNLRLVYELMQLIDFTVADHKRHWISEYQNFEIAIPDSQEQQAIAQVLSDMDREITVLEQRRDKTKELKQGMMQALLTGRIRLPKEDTNDA